MLTVEEALALVKQHVATLEPRRLPLGEAAGLVLAEDITSEVNSPPYDKSLMDGYAVRSRDREPERQILEEIAAGDVPHFPVTPGATSRIMTGAPLPEGADAVVPLEQTELLDAERVRLQQVDPPPRQNVLALGAALRAGDTVLRSGACLRPIEIAILAEIGRGMVKVIPRPRLAILPTGNELVAVGERPCHGQIRNSNGPLLTAAAARAGAEAVELGIARDERDELTRWVEQGLAADVLVLSGGVSAGKFDLVPGVLAGLRVEPVFHKVALRPGKPLWFGVKRETRRNVLVFGLPGNPVSSFVCFELFVRPTIAAMSGRGFSGLPLVQARLSHVYNHKGGRAAYLPALVKWPRGSLLRHGGGDIPVVVSDGGPVDLTVELLPWHGSADLVTLGQANGLACLSREDQSVEAGTPISVVLI
jgi:molybdopterin molybdotransferase